MGPCSQAKGKPRLPRTGRKRCQRAYLSSPKMKATMMKTRKKVRATLMLPRTVKTRKLMKIKRLSNQKHESRKEIGDEGCKDQRDGGDEGEVLEEGAVQGGPENSGKSGKEGEAESGENVWANSAFQLQI